MLQMRMPPTTELMKLLPTLRPIEQARLAQLIHGDYLTLPNSSVTGSHAWHRLWIRVYDGWIAALRGEE